VATISEALERHGVVEVARRLGIDGEEGDLAQVLAIAPVGLRHLGGHGGGERGDVGRELLVDVVDGEDLLDLGARVVGIAEHLEHGHLEDPVRGLGVRRISATTAWPVRAPLRPPCRATGPVMRGSSGSRCTPRPRSTIWPGDLAAPALDHRLHAALEPARATHHATSTRSLSMAAPRMRAAM
jgi:hypothetical protein